MNTGFKDKFGREIQEGDILSVGMRRDGVSCWTKEKIINRNKGFSRFFKKPNWVLINPLRPNDGFLQMQTDEQLLLKL